MSSPCKGGATGSPLAKGKVKDVLKSLPEEEPGDTNPQLMEKQPCERSDRSTSPVPSVLSMKSDMSNLAPINFLGEKATESDRSTSPVHSVLSMKSDMSNLAPINFQGEKATELSIGRMLCDVCSNPAVKKCLTCSDYYCETHVRNHYTCPDLEGHQLQDLQHQTRCEQHHKKLKFYCRTDQSAICSRCLLDNHRGHDAIQQDKTDTDQNMKEQSKVTKSGGVPSPGPIQFRSVGTNSVTVSWSPPKGAPGAFRYKVSWRGRQKKQRLLVASCEVEVAGLLPAEKYHFTVCSLSEDYHESTCVEQCVYTEVPMPENLTVDSSHDSLNWTKPTGVDEVSYLLEVFSISSGEKLKSIHTTADNHPISELAKHGKELTVHVSTVANDHQSKPTTTIFTTGDLRIVLLGKTGSGKSASGNTILRKNLFKEDISTKSVTNKCQKETAEINGRQITVVDTPGLFDTSCNEDSKKEIIRCLDLAAPGPHVFLLVIPVGPFTQEDRNTLRRIKEMFGEEYLRYTIVLFTRKDDLQKKTLEKYIEGGNRSLNTILEEYGNRYHSFNNRAKKDINQVTKLLEIINDMLATNQGTYFQSTYYRTEIFHKIEMALKPGDKTDVSTTVTNDHQSIPTTKSFTTGDLRIVLLGKTGSGKSASGNTILGRKVFKEDISTKSATKECQKDTAVINGRQITVVDTPGLFDTACSEVTEKEIIRCLNMAAPGPHVFLLVISVGPFTQDERNTLRRIKEMFGKEFLSYTLVLFTREDDLQKKTIEKYLNNANIHLKTLLEECGNRYHSFNNKGRSGNRQVTKLLVKINNMLASNQGNYYRKEMV